MEDNIPLYIQIKDDLRLSILSDVYSSGDRIPSESNLMKDFGVSRITIRKALKELHSEGLIFSMQGKGAFALKPKLIQDISQLKSLPESMESTKNSISSILLSSKKVTFDSDIQARLNSKSGYEIIRARSVNKKLISIDTSYFPCHLKDRYNPFIFSNDIFTSLEASGIHLSQASISIEAKISDTELSNQLGIQKGQPIFWVNRLISETGSQPVVFEKLAFRGDSFKYHIDIERFKSD